jgi:hypothetical protein
VRGRNRHQAPLDGVNCIAIPNVVRAFGYFWVMDVLHSVGEVAKVENCRG